MIDDGLELLLERGLLEENEEDLKLLEIEAAIVSYGHYLDNYEGGGDRRDRGLV